jgi:ribonuclease HI
MNITIYTDASHCHHSLVGGWAFWYKYDGNRGKVVSGAERGVADNNDAEMMAAKKSLEHVSAEVRGKFKEVRIVLVTDSQYVCERLSELLSFGAWVGVVVEVRHIKGHTRVTDRRGWINRLVDIESRREMRQLRDGSELVREGHFTEICYQLVRGIVPEDIMTTVNRRQLMVFEKLVYSGTWGNADESLIVMWLDKTRGRLI